jgi:hypothetical protein
MLCVNSWPVYSYILITSRSLVAWTVLNLPRDSTVTRRTAVHVLQFFLPHECRTSGFFSRAVWVWQDSNPTWHFWIGQMQRPCCRKPGTTRLLERPNAYSTWTRWRRPREPAGPTGSRCPRRCTSHERGVVWSIDGHGAASLLRGRR